MKLRRCFLEPIPEIFDAARLLDAAVTAHLANERDVAAKLIQMADIAAIADWSETLWGSWNEVHRKPTGKTQTIPKSERDPKKTLTRVEKKELKSRDGWHCRFCGIPVIDEDARTAIANAYDVKIKGSNQERHSAFNCMQLVYDHLMPHARGGKTRVDNMLVTCAPCNSARYNYTISEMRLIDPRYLSVVKSHWDGLARFCRSG